MAKNGMDKFMDFLRLSDPEEDDFDDDLFEEEDDDFYEEAPKRKVKEKQIQSYEEDDFDDYAPKKTKAKASRNSNPSKLVSINSRSGGRSTQVHVIKPQELNEAQKLIDSLRAGRTIVINMEGIEVHVAQRIIDFIGGACYALEGSLQAISANIFIAAPRNVDVSGDLRDEILNGAILSPELTSL